MPSPYLCERFHPTRGCVSPNFRPETTFYKVAGRVRTADLQTRRLPLYPLLHGGLTKGLQEYQIRSRKRPKQFDLLRRGLETRILEKFVLFSGKSQKNLASYHSLFDERIISDNKQPVSSTLIL